MPAQAWVTLVVGLVAAIGVIVTWRQKNLADRRAQWWTRATWAVDHTLSDNTAAQVVGFEVIAKLQESSLVTKTEADIFADYGRELIDSIAGDNLDELADTEGQEDHDDNH